jgi:hypothetical protein
MNSNRITVFGLGGNDMIFNQEDFSHLINDEVSAEDEFYAALALGKVTDTSEAAKLGDKLGMNLATAICLFVEYRDAQIDEMLFDKIEAEHEYYETCGYIH